MKPIKSTDLKNKEKIWTADTDLRNKAIDNKIKEQYPLRYNFNSLQTLLIMEIRNELEAQGCKERKDMVEQRVNKSLQKLAKSLAKKAVTSFFKISCKDND